VPDSPGAPVVAFLSDYGLADEFVGVCKAVVLGSAPDARFVDLSHEIPAHDVKAGALTLVRAVQYLPAGTIVFAVVDPGVGTDRRLLGVECEHVTLVGPDNGLLAPAVAMVGGARRVVSLTNDEFHLPAPGATFAGRDILAPAVGLLAAGADLGQLGEVVDPSSLVPGLLSLPQVEDGGSISSEVWWVDHFGNCQLNVGPDDLEGLGAKPGGTVEVHLSGTARIARWVTTYADAKPSELVLVVDSYGLLSLALDRRSAAQEHGLHAGSAVVLLPPGATAPVA
jgi:S-adenosyl-L-methionine hydrolase (adenosine-forming)